MVSSPKSIAAVMPAAVVAEPSSPGTVLLARYRQFLIDERDLSRPVAQAYAHWVTPFIEDRAAELTAATSPRS